jgi:uncharacterized SAM-binding protein YcdF (DUF218 family)
MAVENARATGEAASRNAQAHVAGKRKLARRLAWTILAAAATGALAFLAGFVWFAGRVPREQVVLRTQADGIVALTGGALRVLDAVELLAAGYGKRLLITGVNPATPASEFSRRMPDYARLWACCIDLDHTALNTTGNAIETRRWALKHGFRSLVLVTSSYHMPRAMAELSNQLPETRLLAYPVVTEKRAEPWWSNAANAKLLVVEYAKYLVALARIPFEGPETAAARNNAALTRAGRLS